MYSLSSLTVHNQPSTYVNTWLDMGQCLPGALRPTRVSLKSQYLCINVKNNDVISLRAQTNVIGSNQTTITDRTQTIFTFLQQISLPIDNPIFHPINFRLVSKLWSLEISFTRT